MLFKSSHPNVRFEIIPSDLMGSADSASEFLKATNYAGFSLGRNWKPLMISRAEGLYFEDYDGKKYLDFSSQRACVNLGHSNKRVVAAIKSQAERLAFVASSFGTDARIQFTRKLGEVLPENLRKYFFGTSGSEANEAAVKMVKAYFGKEGKTKILSRYNSYHGWMAATAQLTGGPRRFPTETTGTYPGIVHVHDPYCYRCPFGLTYPECGVVCAEYVDGVIKNEKNVGAMILEPVTGASGVVVPPKEYLPKIREITEKHNVLLIADEVMSGWGRVGEWFAVNHWGAKPDILTTGKGITGGLFPLSLTATTNRLGDYFEANWLPAAGTFAAHPLGMAAGVAAVEEYQSQDLIRKSKELGEYLGRRLEEIWPKHVSIGDIRGLGLFWAVELVKNRKTKEPFDTPEDYLEGHTLMIQVIARRMMEMGVFILPGVVSVLVIAPPLIITKDEIDRGIDALDEAIKVADEKAIRD